MAHGTEVNQATGTPQKVATADRTLSTWPVAADGEMPLSVLYQGATPDALSPVNSGNPLHVQGTLTDAQLRATPVPVSASSLPLPTGAATQTTLAAVNTATGATTDAEATGDGTIIAILKRLRTLLGSLGLDATLQAIRDRLPTSLVGGRLDVNVGNTVTIASPAVTNAGTFVVQENGSALTSLQLIDDAISADNSNATKGIAGMHYDGSKHYWNRGDGVNLNVKVNSALPAGTNNIGDVDVLTLPALPAGTNNIGDVDVLTLPALPAGTNNIGDVDVLTQPARARTTDSIAAGLQTDALMNGTTALTPKFAAVNCNTSGDNTIIAAVTSKKIRVLKYRIIPASDVAVTWKSGAGTSLTGAMSLAGKAGDSGAEALLGHFETASGAALVLNLGGAVQVSGYVVYVEV